MLQKWNSSLRISSRSLLQTNSSNPQATSPPTEDQPLLSDQSIGLIPMRMMTCALHSMFARGYDRGKPCVESGMQSLPPTIEYRKTRGTVFMCATSTITSKSGRSQNTMPVAFSDAMPQSTAIQFGPANAYASTEPTPASCNRHLPAPGQRRFHSSGVSSTGASSKGGTSSEGTSSLICTSCSNDPSSRKLPMER